MELLLNRGASERLFRSPGAKTCLETASVVGSVCLTRFFITRLSETDGVPAANKEYGVGVCAALHYVKNGFNPEGRKSMAQMLVSAGAPIDTNRVAEACRVGNSHEANILLDVGAPIVMPADPHHGLPGNGNSSARNLLKTCLTGDKPFVILTNVQWDHWIELIYKLVQHHAVDLNKPMRFLEKPCLCPSATLRSMRPYGESQQPCSGTSALLTPWST
jgi:hypothetical protein